MREANVIIFAKGALGVGVLAKVSSPKRYCRTGNRKERDHDAMFLLNILYCANVGHTVPCTLTADFFFSSFEPY